MAEPETMEAVPLDVSAMLLRRALAPLEGAERVTLLQLPGSMQISATWLTCSATVVVAGMVSTDGQYPPPGGHPRGDKQL